MKRLSACLILFAACTSAFAACSSSDDSSSSGGSGGASAGSAGASSGAGGRAGSSSGGAGGSHALSGAAGEAGESSGGEANGAAGSDQAGAGGEPSSGGTASGSAGTVNGGSAGASGGSSSGGNASGGSATGGSGGNGGISGQGANTGNTSQCGDAAKAAFASGFVAYFDAHIATSGCLSEQMHGADATSTQECAGNGCGADPGCSATFVWHDASYNGATGAFMTQVDVTSALSVTGAATCTLDAQLLSKTVSATITTTDLGTSLAANFESLGIGSGSPTSSGCEVLSNAAFIAQDDMNQLLTQAAQDAVSALSSYSVDCTP